MSISNSKDLEYSYKYTENIIDAESELIIEGAVKLDLQVDNIEILNQLIRDLSDEKIRSLRVNSILSILWLFLKDHLKHEDLLRSLIEFLNNEEAQDRIYNLIYTYIKEPIEIVELNDKIKKCSKDGWIHSKLCAIDQPKTIEGYLNRIITNYILETSILNTKNKKILYMLGRNNYWKIEREYQKKLLLLNNQFVISKIEDINVYINLYTLSAKDELDLERSISLYSENIAGITEYCTKSNHIVLDATNKEISRVEEYKTFTKDKIYNLDSYNLDYRSIDIERSRIGILLVGPPGTGKTCWCYSYYNNILKDLGYVLIILNYDNYKEISLNIKGLKVCLLINDADSIENKESRPIILSKLERNYGKRTITLMTANSEEELDQAFLRKGRIDYKFTLKDKLI